MEIINKLKLAKEKIAIIPILDSKDRQLLHQYFDYHHPEIYKTSLRISYFPSEPKKHVAKCVGEDCDYKTVELQYHYGSMKNNYDEYYDGYCPKCGEYRSYEPNDDDKYRAGYYVVKPHNAIVFGGFFKHYSRSKYPKSHVGWDQVAPLLEKAQVYYVAADFGPIRKSKLGKHFSTKFSESY